MDTFIQLKVAYVMSRFKFHFFFFFSCSSNGTLISKKGLKYDFNFSLLCWYYRTHGVGLTSCKQGSPSKLRITYFDSFSLEQENGGRAVGTASSAVGANGKKRTMTTQDGGGEDVQERSSRDWRDQAF